MCPSTISGCRGKSQINYQEFSDLFYDYSIGFYPFQFALDIIQPLITVEQ